MNIFTAEPRLDDPYLGWRSVLSLALLIGLAVAQQWVALVVVAWTVALWKRSSAPRGDGDA